MPSYPAKDCGVRDDHEPHIHVDGRGAYACFGYHAPAMPSVEELWSVSHCEVCGEKFQASDEVGEFVDPDILNQHWIAHASCGLERDWELA